MPLMEPLVKGSVLTHYGRDHGPAPGQKLSRSTSTPPLTLSCFASLLTWSSNLRRDATAKGLCRGIFGGPTVRSRIPPQDTAESILLLLGKNPCMSTRVLGGRIWKLARGPFLNRLRSSKRKTAFAGWGLQKREDGKSFQRIHWMVSHRMLAGVSAPPRASGTLCSTTYPGRPVTCKPRACVPP